MKPLRSVAARSGLHNRNALQVRLAKEHSRLRDHFVCLAGFDALHFGTTRMARVP